MTARVEATPTGPVRVEMRGTADTRYWRLPDDVRLDDVRGDVQVVRQSRSATSGGAATVRLTNGVSIAVKRWRCDKRWLEHPGGLIPRKMVAAIEGSFAALPSGLSLDGPATISFPTAALAAVLEHTLARKDAEWTLDTCLYLKAKDWQLPASTVVYTERYVDRRPVPAMLYAQERAMAAESRAPGLAMESQAPGPAAESQVPRDFLPQYTLSTQASPVDPATRAHVEKRVLGSISEVWIVAPRASPVLRVQFAAPKFLFSGPIEYRDDGPVPRWGFLDAWNSPTEAWFDLPTQGEVDVVRALHRSGRASDGNHAMVRLLVRNRTPRTAQLELREPAGGGVKPVAPWRDVAVRVLVPQGDVAALRGGEAEQAAERIDPSSWDGRAWAVGTQLPLGVVTHVVRPADNGPPHWRIALEVPPNAWCVAFYEFVMPGDQAVGAMPTYT